MLEHKLPLQRSIFPRRGVRLDLRLGVALIRCLQEHTYLTARRLRSILWYAFGLGHVGLIA